MFNSGLVRTGTRFWYYNKGKHCSNKGIFFTIVEKDYISLIKSTNLIKKEQHYDKDRIICIKAQIYFGRNYFQKNVKVI